MIGWLEMAIKSIDGGRGAEQVEIVLWLEPCER